VQENVAFSIKKAIVRKHLNYKQDQIGPVHYIDLRPDQMGPVEYLTFAYDLVQGMTPDERVDFVNALKDEMTSEQEKALVGNLVREVPLGTTDQGTLGLRKDDRILLESEAKKMTPEEFFREYAYNRILLKSDKYMGIFVGILAAILPMEGYKPFLLGTFEKAVPPEKYNAFLIERLADVVDRQEYKGYRRSSMGPSPDGRWLRRQSGSLPMLY